MSEKQGLWETIKGTGDTGPDGYWGPVGIRRVAGEEYDVDAVVQVLNDLEAQVERLRGVAQAVIDDLDSIIPSDNKPFQQLKAAIGKDGGG